LRLAENFAFEENQGISAKHQGVRMFLGDSAGFAMGVQLAQFVRRQLDVEDFRGIAGQNLKFQVQVTEQFRAAGRSRGQYQWRQFHCGKFNRDNDFVQQLKLKRALWREMR
jgi:hypothetical protein